MDEYLDYENYFSDEEKKIRYKDDIKKISNTFPKRIGELLIKEYRDPDYAILIHRTSVVSNERLFENGLWIPKCNLLDYTTSEFGLDDKSCYDEIDFLKSVAAAYAYKPRGITNPKCVIMKVPKTALTYCEGKSKPILFKTGNSAIDDFAFSSGGYQTYLLPEYILGTVEFDDVQKEKMVDFTKNPKYTEIHNYKNDGLVCTDELIEDFKIKYNKKLLGQRKLKPKKLQSKIWKSKSKEIPLSDDKVTEFIINQNNQYMKEHPEEYTTRTENELKQYSKQGMILSKFNNAVNKIKSFFTKEKYKEEKQTDVDRE